MNYIPCIAEVKAQLLNIPVSIQSRRFLTDILAALDRIDVSDLTPEKEALVESAKPQPGAVAVLSLSGVIVYKAAPILELFGIKSLSSFMRSFREMVAMPEVGSILLDINSPGGSVWGIQEAADEIFQARKRKPVIALANPVAASAAYWLGSAARDFGVIPSGVAGSIGVLAVHQEASEMEKREGIKTTIIKAGKFKDEGNEHEPLSDDARAHIQEGVDAYYAAFTGAVAKHRGVKIADVVNGYGEGRALGSKESVKANLADWIGTFDDVIAELASGKQRTTLRAEGQQAEIQASTPENEIETTARSFWAQQEYR